MRMFLGLLAVSLVGADRPKSVELPMVTYQFRLVEMTGPEWRNDCYARLQPVAKQGDAVIWTAPKGVVEGIFAKAKKVEAAPRMTSHSGAESVITNSANRAFVSGYQMREDAAIKTVSWSGSTPTIETASNGWCFRVAGRKLDQGMLLKVEMNDEHLVAMHNVAIAPTPSSTAAVLEKVEAVTIQVPEVERTKVEGEWLVPKDQVLLVSLGLKSSGAPKGETVVRERLAMLEATPISTTPAVPDAIARMGLPMLAPVARSVPMPAVPAPLPIAPSRSLPARYNAMGQAIPLPPLPEDAALPPTTKEGSDEPCATPQAKSAKSTTSEPLPLKPSQIRDTKAKQAGFEPTDECCEDVACAEKAKATTKAAGPAPAPKSFSFRLPNPSGITIEIRATVSTTSASVPPPPAIPGLKAN